MDATQLIDDSIVESEEEETEEEESENKKREPLAKLQLLKNTYFPETELPLYLGDNVLGRDPNMCTLPLSAPSVSKRHTVISISVYPRGGRHGAADMEALVWDLGSMNGTRRGRLRLTPHVRYALSEGDRLEVADIPCQYFSCVADKKSGQGDMRSPVNRNSGESARRTDPLMEKRCDTSTDSAKCVNGGPEASTMVSSPDQQNTMKTPARTRCLSFEQTPNEPQCTLVPESDCDSDGEKGGGRGRQEKAVVSDSDSCISSPTCSTFLSPTNKIIPESEDESPITPSSTKNRPNKSVSFSKEEKDVDVGRQLKKKKAQVIVSDSDEEEGREEERAATGERQPEESGQDVPVKWENNVSLSGGDGLPVSTPAVSTDAMPVFNMDSDTDVEGEEEEAVAVSASPMTLNITSKADHSSKQVQFHMDSDTDVDEEDDALAKVPNSVPVSMDSTKPADSVPVVQAIGVMLDSDTDVDDDADASVSNAAAKAAPTSHQVAHTADSAPSAEQKDFHLDSDTDVDEEDENDSSKVDETPSRLELKDSRVESASAAPQIMHLDSDTDDEVIPAPATGKPPVVVADTEPPTIADTGADLDILSNSDTDLEEDAPLLPPVVMARNAVPSTAKDESVSLSAAALTTSTALQSDYDGDTDLDEPSVPPTGETAEKSEFRMDSDTDVEDKEVDGEVGEGQMSGLSRETRSRLPTPSVPPLQKCSTPLELSDTQEDQDFVIAETQSFVLENRDRQGSHSYDPTLDSTQAFGLEISSGDEKDGQSSRGGSFQLGLSDSSHLLPQAQALAMENTQAFIPVAGNVDMEDTQKYEAISSLERTSVGKDSDLEATQAYGGDEEPARCSAKKESRVDFALEATQAYIPETQSDTEAGAEEEDRINIVTAETQPVDFPTTLLSVAETQPMSAFEEEDNQVKDRPCSSVCQGKRIKQNERQEKGDDEEATQPQEMPIVSTAETQPMATVENEESEDLIPAPRKRKAKALQLEDKETQPMTSSELSAAETLPMVTCEDEESEDLIPVPRKRKAKTLQLEETQPMTSSELSAAETLPMATCEDEESEDLIPAPRKRKAKPLQLEEETQPMTSSELSAAETLPMATCEDEESEDLIPVPRKRKAKALQLEETQPMTSSELSSSETQPMATCEDEESEDLIPAPRKRRAKPLQLEETQPMTSSELSAAETQPVHDGNSNSEEDEKVAKLPPPTNARSVPKNQKVLTSTLTTNSETQPLDTCAMDEEEGHEEADKKVELQKTTKQPQRGKRQESEAGTSSISSVSKRGGRAVIAEEKLEYADPPKRQTRGNGKALSTTRGRGRKVPEEEYESEETQAVEQSKLSRGRRTRRHQKDNSMEEERKEEVEKDRLLKEQEEKERIETEQRQELERLERERKAEQERLERERKEKEQQERLEHERAEREEKERLEREENARLERERKEQEEKERYRIQKEKEEQERLEMERKKKEEQERLERERAEREEQDRIQREEKARIEKERKEQEENERLEHERAKTEEKERLEREQKARIDRERKEQEEKERFQHEKAEEEKRRSEREKQEREQLEEEAKEKLIKEQHENKDEENKLKSATRGRRAVRRTIADPSTAQVEQDQGISTSEDGPARRTRSRSNSSDSVSSVMSAASVNTQESKGRGRGRGRGRGAKKTTNITRDSRRRTVAGEPSAERQAAEQAGDDTPPLGVLSRSNSINSLNSEVSSCSVSSQNRGRGGRGRGRGRKTQPETDSIPPLNSQSDQSSAPKATARGRKSRKTEGSFSDVSEIDGEEKADSMQSSTTRGQKRASENSEPPAVHGDAQSSKEEENVGEESLVPKRNVRDKGQKAKKDEILTTLIAAAVNDGDKIKEKGRGKGRKRELEEEADEDEGSGSKEKGKAQGGRGREAAKEEKEETHEENAAPIPAKKQGRASTAQRKKNTQESLPKVEVKEESKKIEEIAEKKRKGRQSVAHKKKEEKQEEDGTSAQSSMNQDTSAETPETPTSSASRRRVAPADSSPVAKTPRSSSASPVVAAQSRPASQVYKVLFTGVVDEAGEKVVARLGGGLAKGVADVTCLVTDKVRRTVKFLCAVAKGVPIVTPSWLEKSGKAGSFLSPNAFIVKDAEQEKKFNFCLQESLRTACSQPLLQGYEIHVTKSVKPEPVQMKDIILCCGASFLPRMPSSHKAQTVVISCEEDWSLCGAALAASLPVVTAEFILTGILQQKVDLEAHALPAPTQPAGGRGRGRKKT